MTKQRTGERCGARRTLCRTVQEAQPSDSDPTGPTSSAHPHPANYRPPWPSRHTPWSQASAEVPACFALAFAGASALLYSGLPSASGLSPRPTRKATWRSGYATVCKTVYPGSIPGVASTNLRHLPVGITRLTGTSSPSVAPKTPTSRVADDTETPAPVVGGLRKLRRGSLTGCTSIIRICS